MSQAIAIVGMACRYPEARTPGELWENVLAQRQAFRRIPPERLSLGDYFSADRQAPDSIYATEGAFVEGFEFDRVSFRVAGSTYRATDPAHWLALEVATAALADAGYPSGEGLRREGVGVYVGNTLTGEFSRANMLRLRWPYLRRVIDHALRQEAWETGRRRAFLNSLEEAYKKPFPPVGEETLAGGLSNTIAGRICNYYDFRGGGYTLDGACASSLLAIINACSSLAAGDVDVALAGGVDLSLDPFELVGFSKVGALAPDRMRVYDTRAAGFWPGEGCGMVVLMRLEDALAGRRRVYAVVRGWGVSSDGSGGITRPEVEGQLLALRRAYARAGFGIETVAYFEGHGTGTGVGDAVELQAVSRARREANASASPAVIGSVKANIGHTKAAAGVAGFIKATMALDSQLLPPATGCEEPRAELRGKDAALRILRRGERWPADQRLRAGVSAMGFGGINAHVALESTGDERLPALSPNERALVSSTQDCELFLLAATDFDALLAEVERLLSFAARLSLSELADLSARLEKRLRAGGARAAVVAATPAELSSCLDTLRAWIREGVRERADARRGVFLGAGTGGLRVAFLFPGQGAPAYLDGGAWRRRFECVDELYAHASAEATGDGVATAVAQPAIVRASLAALRVLARLGVHADVGVGHSLGELTALHWAGVLDEEAVLRVARVRGRVMTENGRGGGAMVSIAADHRQVAELLDGEPVVIAGINSPRQTVISGEASGVESVVRRAKAAGFACVKLAVSHGFHSPLVADAAPPLAAQLKAEEFRAVRSKVVSTVTGRLLTPDTDLRDVLRRQVTEPVRFMDAFTAASESGIDLWIEVGPGKSLSGIVRDLSDVPVIALDACGPSVRGLWHAVGACFVAGVPVAHEELFARRFVRPFELEWSPKFFLNPCELAPRDDAESRADEQREAHEDEDAAGQGTATALHGAASTLEFVRALVAARAELPAASVGDADKLLDDLHLNSITVGQLIVEAARGLGLRPPSAPTDYANASVAEVARSLEDLGAAGEAPDEEGESPAGVETWIRAFTCELIERPRARGPRPSSGGAWQVVAVEDDPLAVPLREAFSGLNNGRGVVVLLPREADEGHVGLLLKGARLALNEQAGGCFVLVQHGGVGAAFARTLKLEAGQLNVCVVDVPRGDPRAVAWIVAEAEAAEGYVEAHYDADGVRRVPILRPLPLTEGTGDLQLGPRDVLIVTGGARGITAECALALARETGARVALFGLSEPDGNEEITTNLRRMEAAGIHHRYLRVDVTDADAVRAAVAEVEAEFGAVTGVVHGAARNVPRLIADLDEASCLKTIGTKVKGARHLLDAINPEELRLFIAFGSIIARTGLPGEADYGLANEWLTKLTEEWQAAHPWCRCLAAEWSVWSGVGMGARIGGVDALTRQGITPISPESGVSALRRLLSHPLPVTSVVVMGRFRELPTFEVERPALPFFRFLEKPRVHYHKVELVIDAELSTGTDPYLNDHSFQGEMLLPGVMGLEAVAQAAQALTGLGARPDFEHVAFLRPLIVPEAGTLPIRIAALARAEDSVEVTIRCAETSYQVDHLRAVCRFGAAARAAAAEARRLDLTQSFASSSLDPARDLYGRLLFHRGRFRRLRGYRSLSATECLAEITPDAGTKWFSRYLPEGLVLSDPGARDAAIHAIQACIPHVTLLPIGIDRITHVAAAQAAAPRFVGAREIERGGNTFVYDLELYGEEGGVCERWEGVRLQAVSGARPAGGMAEPLWGPYMERVLKDVCPEADISVAVELAAGENRRALADHAMRRALGDMTPVLRRTDGKPEAADGRQVSASHARDLALAVAGRGPLACDVERVVARAPSAWRDMLGADRAELAAVIIRDTDDEPDTAATRVWCACECLKKVGSAPQAPLVFAGHKQDGWVFLASGALTVASFVAGRQGADERLVVSALLRSGSHAGL